jgi:hypothetical protein
MMMSHAATTGRPYYNRCAQFEGAVILILQIMKPLILEFYFLSPRQLSVDDRLS